MEKKLLDLHADKSCYILIGNKKEISKLQKEIEQSPITLYGQKLKEKSVEKYLGDLIHSEGNSASVKATVDDRYGKIVSLIIESRAIIDDCRMNSIRGLSAGL